jgi:hypothetical protein
MKITHIEVSDTVKGFLAPEKQIPCAGYPNYCSITDSSFGMGRRKCVCKTNDTAYNFAFESERKAAILFRDDYEINKKILPYHAFTHTQKGGDLVPGIYEVSLEVEIEPQVKTPAGWVKHEPPMRFNDFEPSYRQVLILKGAEEPRGVTTERHRAKVESKEEPSQEGETQEQMWEHIILMVKRGYTIHELSSEFQIITKL